MRWLERKVSSTFGDILVMTQWSFFTCLRSRDSEKSFSNEAVELCLESGDIAARPLGVLPFIIHQNSIHNLTVEIGR